MKEKIHPRRVALRRGALDKLQLGLKLGLIQQQMGSTDLWTISEEKLPKPKLRTSGFSKRIEPNEDLLYEKNVSIPPKHEESILNTLKWYLIFGQCFDMIPVCGVLSGDPQHVKFSWKSKRTVFCLFIISVYIFLTALQIISTIKKGNLTFKNADYIIGYFVYTSTAVILFRQARTLPKLMVEWAKLEREMRGLTPVKGMSRKVNAYTLIFFIGTMLFAATRLISPVAQFSRCSSDPATVAQYTVIGKYYGVFSVIPYSPPAGFLMAGVFLHQTVQVVYDELTIAVFPLCLAERFRQLRRHLDDHARVRDPAAFWAEMRGAYDGLSRVANLLGRHLSSITLLSFGSNLYHICSLLLLSLNPENSKWTNWTILYLLAFTVGRTSLAALMASSVHEESKKPLPLLYSVPAESYNVEVCRFQMQVTHDTVAITGCNFFAVTRAFMLTVAGTIITYEIVLLQFSTWDENTDATFSYDKCSAYMAILTNQRNPGH